jgi:hypothetical protein
MLEKERKKRKHKKEMKSLKNKMSNHLVWFESLSPKKQYDILFLWKHEKRFNNLTEPTITKTSWGDITSYPPNFKHFINKLKQQHRFKVNKQTLRQNAIDLILNKNN